MEAVKQDVAALEYVPEEYKTVELCWEAYKRDSYTIKYIPQKIIDEMKSMRNDDDEDEDDNEDAGKDSDDDEEQR